jgi:hypothetical protein
MSDLLIFIVGTGIFSITTAATLLYGYFTFYKRAEEDRDEQNAPIEV